MKIRIQDYNDVAVVELQGELDSDSIELFQKTITDIIAPLPPARGKKGGVVLDMSDLGFIDSAGLAQLLWARECCDENNCQLRLAGLDETLMKILEVTRLENQFECYEELAKAVKSFA
jgi:anti-sigma B factor antagonist